jgi:D-alanine-D-alanine ligase
MSNKLRVALLVGGDSSERPVSLVSGQSVAGAIPDKFDVTIFDVAQAETHAAQNGYVFPAPVVPVTWDNLAATLRGFDVALPILHGGWGEDGTLQTLLDVAGVPYVGSGPRANVVAMDKQLCKAFVRDLGVPVAPSVSVDSVDELQSLPFAGPCVVKPRAGGSSVGVTLLTGRSGDDLSEVFPAIENALADGNGALIEQFISGQEITCGVLGQGNSARALPVLEIVPQSAGGFYDYEAKYTQGGSLHLHPPRLPDEAAAHAQNLALKIFRALGCRGVARADFIVSEGTPYFLEINTLPGMTELSLVPDAARHAGIEFPQLLETLIESAARSK